MSERGKQSQEAAPKKPPTKVEVKNALDAQMRGVDAKLRVDAKKLLEDESFRQKLSGENLNKFLEGHSKDDYSDYRQWNKDFLEKVLGLKDLTPVQERIHILALQELLNKEKGGFTEKHGNADSLDGKLGPYTLSKIAEYLNKKTEPAKSDNPAKEDKPAMSQTKPATDEKAPEPTVNKDADVLSRLGEKERFDPKNVYCAGDSFMEGIASRVKKENKNAVSGSQLSRTPKFDNKTYRNKYIFIEEEAMKFLDDPECKLLVVNGGINDLAARGGNNEKKLDEIADQIIDSYKKIIEKAHSKGIKVAIYKLYTGTTPDPTRENRRKASDKVNQWLKEKSGADVLLDTTSIVKGRMFKNHPTSGGYAALYKTLTNSTQKIEA